MSIGKAGQGGLREHLNRAEDEDSELDDRVVDLAGLDGVNNGDLIIHTLGAVVVGQNTVDEAVGGALDVGELLAAHDQAAVDPVRTRGGLADETDCLAHGGGVEGAGGDLDAVAHDDSTVFPDDGHAGAPGEHVDECPHLSPGRGREGDAARVHLVEQLVHAGREVLIVVQEGAIHVDGGQAQVGARVTRRVSGGHHGSIVPDGRHGCSHRGRGWGDLTLPRAVRA